MHKICNKKLKQDTLNPKSDLLRTSFLGLVIQITANFTLALRSILIPY